MSAPKSTPPHTTLRDVLTAVNALDTKLSDKIDALGERVAELNTGAAVSDVRVDTLQSEVDRLRGQSTVWNGVNSVMAVIAGVFGATK